MHASFSGIHHEIFLLNTHLSDPRRAPFFVVQHQSLLLLLLSLLQVLNDLNSRSAFMAYFRLPLTKYCNSLFAKLLYSICFILVLAQHDTT